MATHSEGWRRSLVKSITFRIVVIISDTTIVYLLTHKIALAVDFVVLTNLASAALYYLHERVWNKVEWERGGK